MTPNIATDRLSNARTHLELLMTADQAVPGWRGNSVPGGPLCRHP
jgi:hypothetical protein